MAEKTQVAAGARGCVFRSARPAVTRMGGREAFAGLDRVWRCRRESRLTDNRRKEKKLTHLEYTESMGRIAKGPCPFEAIGPLVP